MTFVPLAEVVAQEKEMTVIIRPEFKKLCGSARSAAIFNHLLYWIAYKQAQGETYWYATGAQIYKQLCETWGISYIRKDISTLIEAGLIGATNNPQWGADRTKFFYFGTEQAKVFFTLCAQEKICPCCIGLPKVISDLLTPHLLNLLNANNKLNTCICQNHQMELLNLTNASVKFNKAITKESTKETTKNILRETSEEREDSLVASAHAESDGESASFLSQFEETSQALNGKAPRDVSSCAEEGRNQGEPLKSADTSKEPACTSAAHSTTHEEEMLQESPQEVALVPTIQDAPTQPVPTRETYEQDELKIRRKIKECSPEIQARRRKWQAYFNQRRGGEPLLTKGECIGESKAIADLVDRFTDAQLEAIDAFVLAEIFKFKLPANKHKLGGCELLRESQNAREVLKERYKWPSRDAKAGSISPTMGISPPVDKYVLEIRKRAAETAARNAVAQGVAL